MVSGMATQEPLVSMVSFHNEFVEYCGGRREADMRLEELMRMDMNSPMPDEMCDVDVSSCFDRETVTELRERYEDYEGGIGSDVVQANLLIGKVPVRDE